MTLLYGVDENEDPESNGKENGASLGFEATLWPAADKRRNDRGTAEYKRIVLRFIFFTSIAAAFSELGAKLTSEPGTAPRYTPGMSA